MDEREEYKTLVPKSKKVDITPKNTTKVIYRSGKDKSHSSGKFLKKARIQGVDPKKVIRSFEGQPLVKEGRTGYFSDEYAEEIKWLS